MSRQKEKKVMPKLPPMPEFDEWTKKLLGDPFDPEKFGGSNPKHYEDFMQLMKTAAPKPEEAEQT